MTTGRTDLVPIPRPYTDTWIPDEEDEFRIWLPKPRSIEIDWDRLERELLRIYKELNPDAPIRDVDPPRPGNRMSRFDDPGLQATAARVPQPGGPAAPAPAMALPAYVPQPITAMAAQPKAFRGARREPPLELLPGPQREWRSRDRSWRERLADALIGRVPAAE
jgi:hypothetical protein